MITFDILPLQAVPTNGWTVSYSFLREVQEAAENHYGEHVCLEGVEAVLLACFDYLALSQMPAEAEAMVDGGAL